MLLNILLGVIIVAAVLIIIKKKGGCCGTKKDQPAGEDKGKGCCGHDH